MKRAIPILIVLICVSSSLSAQLWKLKRLEVTGAAGTTHSFTDIGRYSGSGFLSAIRDISRVNTGLAISGNASYRVTSDLAARVNLTYGFLHASDINGSQEARSFEAITVFFEPAAMVEFYIIRNKRENAYLFLNNRRSTNYRLSAYFDVYLFTGIGAVIRDVTPNPQLALYASETKGITPVIPAGIGISRIFSDSFKGGIELSGRYLLGDDIEALDVPARGNDSYYYLSLNLTWRLKSTRYPTF